MWYIKGLTKYPLGYYFWKNGLPKFEQMKALEIL